MTEVEIGKLGDSLMIRISRKLTEFMQLKKGTELKVYPIDKSRFAVEVNHKEGGYQKDIATGQYQNDILRPN